MRVGAWIAAAVLLAGPVAHGRAFEGVVTRVVDGDTVAVRPAHGGRPVTVRLHGIDAPERCQPHGQAARNALRQHLLRQAVRVDVIARDDYDRLLARVERGDEDVARWLVREGHAWSPGFRARPGAYAADEAAARQGRRGLWADSHAIAPRSFRREHGPCAPGRPAALTPASQRAADGGAAAAP